jgi:hypothetical protein
MSHRVLISATHLSLSSWSHVYSVCENMWNPSKQLSSSSGILYWYSSSFSLCEASAFCLSSSDLRKVSCEGQK